MVESVVRANELVEVRLEWVTPVAHRFDRPGAGWIARRLTVLAKGDESERFEFWSPDSGLDWEPALAQLPTISKTGCARPRSPGVRSDEQPCHSKGNRSRSRGVG